MCLSTGQGRGGSETPVRKGFGDHTRVGMVIGGRPPKGSLCPLSTAPSPPGVTFVPPVETYQHQGEARPGPNGHPARGISIVRLFLG